MKILHVGASGTVGEAVGRALRARGHDVVAAHRTSATHPVDITDPGSISELLARLSGLDAIVSTAGGTPFGPWDELGRDEWRAGLDNKLLGQIELVRQGSAVVRPGGSFTLITGITAREPVPEASIAAAVNGALESWVRTSAAELWGRFRINAVSPTVLTESREHYASVFPGFPFVDGERVGDAYVRSVESLDTGAVYVL